MWHDAANAAPERDPVEEDVQKGARAGQPAQVQGQLRAIESLGAWSGASLVTQLKVPAIATIDRELWLQQGVAGASRPGEVDVKTQQRQSIGGRRPHKGRCHQHELDVGRMGNRLGEKK